MIELKFFADHCVPTYIINSLKDSGFEVYRLKDYIPKDSPDSIVISTAQELNSILISLNGDFADIVTYPPSNYIWNHCNPGQKPSRNNSIYCSEAKGLFAKKSRC